MSSTNNAMLSAALRVMGLVAFGLALPLSVDAASTDLSSSPLVTSSSSSVYPNVFVMMDDSGSMNWDFLPDNLDYAYFPIGTYGYASNQCNGAYYDRNTTYTLPYKYDGSQYGAESFTNADNDGFGVNSSNSTNLSTSFQIGLYQDDSTSSTYSGASQPTAAPAYRSGRAS